MHVACLETLGLGLAPSIDEQPEKPFSNPQPKVAVSSAVPVSSAWMFS